MSINELSFVIRGAIFRVYKELGPGLLESVYEQALCYELRELGLEVKSQIDLPLIYRGVKMDGKLRIDVIVNDQILIEIKSVEELSSVHHKQVITYLKLSGLKLGILVNFNSDDVNKTMFRKVNNL
jgi:GxxExxY protein